MASLGLRSGPGSGEGGIKLPKLSSEKKGKFAIGVN
jgi:hypothetical protein